MKQATDSQDHSVQIGRIIMDCHARTMRGESVDLETTVQAHPEYAAEIRAEWPLIEKLADQNPQPSNATARAMARFAELAAGTALGAFELIELLGSGASSLVFKAKQARLNRMVALKVLRPEFGDDPVGSRRFEREAMTIGGLNHPNLVTVYEAGNIDGLGYMAMELIEGHSLATLIATQAPLPSARARTIFNDILNGLKAAHDAGVIHRDIKPANILIDEHTGSARIVDFGLARLSDAATKLTITSSVIGTLEYMSPEQARGDADLDERTDLYSAGVVLYEMLTGQRAFKSSTLSGTLYRVLNDTPSAPDAIVKGVDRDLALTAMRLMAKERDDRSIHSSNKTESSKASRSKIIKTSLVLAIAPISLFVAFYLPALLGVDDNKTVSPPAQLAMPTSSVEIIRNAKIRDGFESEIYIWSGAIAEPKLLAITSPATNRHFNAVSVCNTTNGQYIVAANNEDLGEGHIYIYKTSGELVRTIPWMNKEDRAWPDCPKIGQMHIRPGSYNIHDAKTDSNGYKYTQHVLFTADLYGDESEEIVMVGRDFDFYPSCICILSFKSDTWVKDKSFWHFGELYGAFILHQVLDDGQPAIFAYGTNNKFDGFGDPPPHPYIPIDNEQSPVTDFDMVPVAMILDPASSSFDGLGPPYTRRIPDLPNAKPLAYGFLDMPTDTRNYADNPNRDEIKLPCIETARLVSAQMTTTKHNRRSIPRIRLIFRNAPEATKPDDADKAKNEVEVEPLFNLGEILVDQNLRPLGAKIDRHFPEKQFTAHDLIIRWHVYPLEK